MYSNLDSSLARQAQLVIETLNGRAKFKILILDNCKLWINLQAFRIDLLLILAVTCSFQWPSDLMALCSIHHRAIRSVVVVCGQRYVICGIYWFWIMIALYCTYWSIGSWRERLAASWFRKRVPRWELEIIALLLLLLLLFAIMFADIQ